jgi:cbb3-type cytochrome oxidase cytochrome c subunit
VPHDRRGGSPGAPDLTHVGKAHDAKWLHDWISAPDEIDAGANMPGFGQFLTADQMTALVKYLPRGSSQAFRRRRRPSTPRRR